MKKAFASLIIFISLFGCATTSSLSNGVPTTSSFNSEYTTSANKTTQPSTSSKPSVTTTSKNNTTGSNTTSIIQTSMPTTSIKETYYTATFLNYDGSLLYEDNHVKEGTIPQYKGPIPTKEGTYKLNYVFKGWDTPLYEIYENTTYTATYKEEKIYYTIEDLVTFDNEYPLHYGKEVYLENVGIISVYSNDTFCVESVHNPLDYYSIEVKAKENIKETYTSGDVVTVVGILDLKNGRPFINNASVSWGYDGDQYSADNAAYIGTVKLDDREYWENKITKQHSGKLYYSYMTVASIPEIKPGEDISFYITFPGEDIEITDRNIFLIEVRIPSLTIDEADYVSTWIKQFNKGDGIYINLQVYYDNKLMALLPYDILNSSSFNTPYTHKNVYSSYDPVSTFLKKEFSEEYITFPDMSNNYTYNYVTKTASETVNNSTMKYRIISFYTYEKEELINHLIDLYSSNENFTYVGLEEDNKYWVLHPYSPNLDMYICFYQGFGKIVFEMHFLI